MRHQHDARLGDQQRHPGDTRQPHYAAPMDRDRLYDGLPAVTNRGSGPDEADRDFAAHQGRYGESQGRHAQSGHGRGAQPAGDARDERISRGPQAGHRGRGPRGYVRSDDSITDESIVRLTEADHIDAREILLIVEDGVVTLTGNVPRRAMKHAAEDVVADVLGVRDIVNRLRVDDGLASLGRPGEAVRTGADHPGSGFSGPALGDRADEPSDQPHRRGY